MSKKVVVVLFTYNEKDTLEKTVEDILNTGKDLPNHNIELVISDSESPDGTGEIAERLSKKNPKIHYISVGRGLGVGIIEGHKYSIKNLKPDIMAQIDADGQVEVDVLPRLIKVIDDGYDLALGSRFVKGGKNQLSLSRRIFTWGSSLVFRLFIGPMDIQEVTNSARAFTPELFRKINLERLPWREQSFIIQPAFLHEAVLVGAKYKEVPLVFKYRAEGYSKNKVFNYVYDMMAYSIECFLQRFGVNIPVFRLSRRSKTFIKFAIVGFSGTVIDFLFYNLFIKVFGISPGPAKVFSAEIAIVNNFIFNNFWTFKNRNTNTSLLRKFLTFNFFYGGSILIAFFIVDTLHGIYGDGRTNILGLFNISYHNLYFLASIIPVLTWNFTLNHFVTFRHSKKKED